MKLVRQIVLGFREGTSDKVYEIDLCELGPDRFVVNFRFGRRGGTLKDGSKTPLPVSRKEADRVYDALVREKTAKGYREGAVGEAPAAAPPPSGPIDDPRARTLVAVLGGARANIGREGAIWRVGELRIAAALPALLPLLAGATNRRTWNVVRALLRLGDPAALPSLWAVWESPGQPAGNRGLAAHAILACSTPEEADRFRQRLRDALPGGIRAALAAGDVDALAGACAGEPDLPDRLYAASEPTERAAVVGLMRRLPFAEPTFLGVRRVYQAAEARADGPVWAAIQRRFDLGRPGVSRVMRRRGGGIAGAFSAATRRWFRRRTWRTLRRLGEAGSADYVALAAALLAEVTDGDSRSVVSGQDWSRWTAIGPFWTFGHVLFGQSPRFRANGPKLSFRAWGREAPATREDLFPALWDAAPDALASLLSASSSGEVHRFAARALRANPAAWPRVPLADLAAWFAAPHAGTVAFAADVAITRYDPKNPDTALVGALLGCPVDRARDLAARWVRENPGPFLRDPAFLLGLVLSPAAPARRVALELLSGATLPPDGARALVDGVVARALEADPGDADWTARLRDAAVVLVGAFATELHALPLDVVARLVAHPSAGAAELGAKALLGHRVRPVDLPDDLLAAAMTSPHAVVRGVGIRLYGELPEATLAERFRVLLALTANALPDVRASARPIVGRLAATNAGFARVFLRALLPVLVGEGPEELHVDLVSLLREELRDAVRGFDAASVLRLCRAASTRVQELGGELLRTLVDPGALAMADLARLAGSDVLGVRRTAWLLLEARAAELRADPDLVLPLLDAPWEDSRRFGFRLVEEKVGAEHLPAAVTIAVCDSVRPDVMAFGRALVARAWKAEDGPRYLAMLAQHPEPAMQLHASAWLEDHASGDPGALETLAPFFAAVLGRPNRAKAAKLRVLAFLAKEAVRDEASARIVARVLAPVSLSAARTHREAAIRTLTEIAARFPEVPTGVRRLEPRVEPARSTREVAGAV